MVSEQTRTAAWEALIEADYLSRYWAEIAARQHQRERWLQGTQLLLNATATLTLLAALGLDALWPKVVALLATAASTALQIAKTSRQASASVQLVQGWGAIRADHDALWNRLPSMSEEAALAELQRLDAKSPALDAVATAAFQRDEELQLRTFNETLAARHVA